MTSPRIDRLALAAGTLAFVSTLGTQVAAVATDGEPSDLFESARTYGVGVSPSSVAAGDFNGDGTTDLAAANRGANSVSILLGSREGLFPTRLDLGVGEDPWAVAVADIDGDGKNDLAFADRQCFAGSIPNRASCPEPFS